MSIRSRSRVMARSSTAPGEGGICPILRSAHARVPAATVGPTAYLTLRVRYAVRVSIRGIPRQGPSCYPPGRRSYLISRRSTDDHAHPAISSGRTSCPAPCRSCRMVAAGQTHRPAEPTSCRMCSSTGQRPACLRLSTSLPLATSRRSRSTHASWHQPARTHLRYYEPVDYRFKILVEFYFYPTAEC